MYVQELEPVAGSLGLSALVATLPLMIVLVLLGGVLGKMISPQNLTIACAAAGLAGREGDLLREVLPWSLGLLLVMCLIVVGQSTPVLDWMLP